MIFSDDLQWDIHIIDILARILDCVPMYTQSWYQYVARAVLTHGSNLRESRFSRILENFFPISLLDLDLEAFSFHFSLSISISRHFHFTFHSRNEWKEKQIHFSFLEKSESISDFTLFLEKKEWIMHVLSWKIQKNWSCITQKCSNFIMAILFLKTILVNVMKIKKINSGSDFHRLQLTGSNTSEICIYRLKCSKAISWLDWMDWMDLWTNLCY